MGLHQGCASLFRPHDFTAWNGLRPSDATDCQVNGSLESVFARRMGTRRQANAKNDAVPRETLVSASYNLP